MAENGEREAGVKGTGRGKGQGHPEQKGVSRAEGDGTRNGMGRDGTNQQKAWNLETGSGNFCNQVYGTSWSNEEKSLG